MMKYLGAAAAALFFGSTAAQAAILQAHTVDCGGFSTCSQANFDIAVAGEGLVIDEFLDFDVPPAGLNDVSGDIFSSMVTFSSKASSTFGGVDSPDVRLSSAGPNSQIGPVGTFDGILVIDFLAPVAAVGMATVEWDGPTEVIRLFDGTTELLSINAFSGSTFFDYVGFVADAGEQITRVEIEGDFFAIQNMSYANAEVVPVPPAIALMGGVLGAFGLIARRRAAKA